MLESIFRQPEKCGTVEVTLLFSALRRALLTLPYLQTQRERQMRGSENSTDRQTAVALHRRQPGSGTAMRVVVTFNSSLEFPFLASLTAESSGKPVVRRRDLLLQAISIKKEVKVDIIGQVQIAEGA